MSGIGEVVFLANASKLAISARRIPEAMLKDPKNNAPLF